MERGEASPVRGQAESDLGQHFVIAQMIVFLIVEKERLKCVHRADLATHSNGDIDHLLPGSSGP